MMVRLGLLLLFFGVAWVYWGWLNVRETISVCDLCGEEVGVEFIDGVLYCDDCLSPDEVTF